VPKPIKLLEGIGNGALIWSTAILWTNDHISYFYDLLESMGNTHCLSTCRFIFRATWRSTPLYCPMRILACLTGV